MTPQSLRPKRRKLILKQVGENEYLVSRLINMIEPPIGARLNDRAVEIWISDRTVDVEISGLRR